MDMADDTVKMMLPKPLLNHKPSIRQKITLGYYAIVAIIIALSVFAMYELRFIGSKIMFGEAVSEFFDTTLEIRRFEKNYYLYRQKSAYDENIRYVNKAQELLGTNRGAFTAIASDEQISMLRSGLATYKTRMDRYEYLNRLDEGGASDAEKIRLEMSIRNTGKDIVTVAEVLSKTERASIQALLNNSQRVLFFSIVLLVSFVIVSGRVLVQMIVKPLKHMEKSMKIIAEGRFEIIPIDSKEREVLSLTAAINKMLRELELRQRHLIQSEKLASLGTLLSGVAHELNNPLANASLSCQLLKDKLEESAREPKEELLSMISAHLERANNIVRPLLEFARIKAFKKELLPLKRLFEETILFVKGQVPTRTFISLDIADDLSIVADKQRIQQAFLNLIKNALDAIQGEGHISIKAQKRLALEKAGEDETGIHNYLKYRGKCTVEDDTVDIEIRDSGSGVRPDVLPKIFDPFFTTKDLGKGSGLGLFIVHEIIEEHDGCIAVDSEVGKGTTFLIRLPIPGVAS